MGYSDAAAHDHERVFVRPSSYVLLGELVKCVRGASVIKCVGLPGQHEEECPAWRQDGVPAQQCAERISRMLEHVGRKQELVRALGDVIGQIRRVAHQRLPNRRAAVRGEVCAIN